ncbi:MAG: hypothetical protein A3E84_05060 [Gammaproteobacteria bacterium RIFCSPHIGHO2_12_FULL_42_13]|nr:MAG: hypothetical protein A3E84_05060 [Gammaproteobacteria bacterium RIFCSPHIGHO2_12_FULL_42_13]
MGCCICQSGYTINLKSVLFGPNLISETNCEQCGHYFLSPKAEMLIALLRQHDFFDTQDEEALVKWLHTANNHEITERVIQAVCAEQVQKLSIHNRKNK